MGKHLIVLLACLFVVMIGLGITLPILPFYVERLALAEGVSRKSVIMHVSLLTGVYSFGQLIFAPIWGRLSDRTGRRPLILIGIGGFVLSQILFGLSTSLAWLYVARILGGMLSAAIFPVSAAYVADMTTKQERARGMAWLGSAVSLGFVVGPALGGLLSRTNLHLSARFGHFRMDGFSIPFFASAFFGLIPLFTAIRYMPESLAAPKTFVTREEKVSNSDWRYQTRSLGPLLGLSLIGQFGLASFEAVFALYAQAKLNYGPTEVGAVFLVCGLVMTLFQMGAVGSLAGRIREIYQIGAGFALMGASLGLLVTAHKTYLIYLLVGLLALGTAIVSPNITALISKLAVNRGVGVTLGIQSAANSLGQATAPLLGGALFVWKMKAPFLMTGALLGMVGLAITLKSMYRRGGIRLVQLSRRLL